MKMWLGFPLANQVRLGMYRVSDSSIFTIRQFDNSILHAIRRDERRAGKFSLVFCVHWHTVRSPPSQSRVALKHANEKQTGTRGIFQHTACLHLTLRKRASRVIPTGDHSHIPTAKNIHRPKPEPSQRTCREDAQCADTQRPHHATRDRSCDLSCGFYA
jgi:hypothetical protein